MKIKIIKGLISVFGAFNPGMVVSVPERFAKSWAKNGIAEIVDEEYLAKEAASKSKPKKLTKRQVAEAKKAEEEAKAKTIAVAIASAESAAEARAEAAAGSEPLLPLPSPNFEKLGSGPEAPPEETDSGSEGSGGF